MKIIRTAGLEVPELEVYTRLNERQVKTIFEPDAGIFICESKRVIDRALSAGYEPLSAFCEESCLPDVQELAGQYDIPVYVAAYNEMRAMTGYSLTGGILMAMRRKALPDAEEIMRSSSRIVVLDDVENPTNVGAIFRSAAALGAEAVLLTAGSADPLYRRAARVSMGSVFLIKWTFADETMMEKLKANGFETYALALSDHAQMLGELATGSSKQAIILGNEDHGISGDILSSCDHCVMIPMQNGVDSLNVAAASAVAFWEIFGI